MHWISFVSLLSVALAGCGAAHVNSEDRPTSNSSVPQETNLPATPLSSTPRQWDDMPIDPPLPIPANADLETLIEGAKADLAQRLSVQATQIKALETKEVVWPDTSLGCPQPGIAYAQILTPGYLIRLAYSGNEFEYHIDVHGNTSYCENPTPPISGTIAPP
jgi:hypothetical protein